MNVLTEYDAVAGREAQKNSLGSDDRRRQKSRSRVGEFEIDLFSSRPWQHAAILEGYCECARRHERPEHPQRQGHADTTDRLEHDSGHSEDASANDSRDGQDVGARPANVST